MPFKEQGKQPQEEAELTNWRTEAQENAGIRYTKKECPPHLSIEEKISGTNTYLIVVGTPQDGDRIIMESVSSEEKITDIYTYSNGEWKKERNKE